MSSCDTLSTQESNQMILDYYESGMEKKANDSVMSLTRTTVYEDSWREQVVPSVKVNDEDLIPELNGDGTYIIFEKEPDAPAASALPFGDNSAQTIFLAMDKYPLYLRRVRSVRFMQDLEKLRGYRHDIRQLMADGAAKQLHTEDDASWNTAVMAVLGSRDSVNSVSGQVQYQSISASVERVAVVDSLMVMNRLPWNLEPAVCVCNTIMWKQFMKWGRDEMGGDLAQDVVKHGMHESEFLNRRWVVTIKKSIVPEDRILHFGDPSTIGKAVYLTEPTMFAKREGPMIEYYFYRTYGKAIGHTGGITAVDFV